MERGLPLNEMSGSPPDILENHFAELNIGTRRKTTQGRLNTKKDENCVEEDHVFQENNVLEQWNSLDRITFDDTESSDWERSNSSSMSWLDESEQETTLKVKNMMDNIDKILYGEPHSPVPRAVAEECQQWKLRFPHLRVLGKAVDVNCVEVQKINQSYLARELTMVEGDTDHLSNDENKDKLEEDKEETYASHGTIEHEPLLPHEFQQASDPIVDSETRIIREALVDELTKHVWKEVVEPRIKAFMEKITRTNKDENVPSSPHTQCLFDAGVQAMFQRKPDKDKCTSCSEARIHMPLSARELGQATTTLSSNNETFEAHRRHSDQVSLGQRKCKNRLPPCKISEEQDEDEETFVVNSRCHWSAVEDEKRAEFSTRMPEITDVQGDTLMSAIPKMDRLQFHTPRLNKPTGVVERLKPREKSGAPTNLNLRSGKKNESMKHSERQTQSKSRHVRLPAIEDHKWLAKNEASNSYGRSSSALPKLAPKTLRPTMSSYKSVHGERTTPTVKRLPFKHQINPFKDETDVCFNKLNRSREYSLVQPTIVNTFKFKEEKMKKEKYFDP